MYFHIPTRMNQFFICILIPGSVFVCISLLCSSFNGKAHVFQRPVSILTSDQVRLTPSRQIPSGLKAESACPLMVMPRLLQLSGQCKTSHFCVGSEA